MVYNNILFGGEDDISDNTIDISDGPGDGDGPEKKGLSIWVKFLGMVFGLSCIVLL